MLAAFFGSDTIPFTTTSEDIPGVSRSYASFSEAAAEAGMSRIYGGIHFMSTNTHSHASGARLGQYVTENFLKKTDSQQIAPARVESPVSKMAMAGVPQSVETN